MYIYIYLYVYKVYIYIIIYVYVYWYITNLLRIFVVFCVLQDNYLTEMYL